MSAMNDLRLFRIYEPHELGPDGYPVVWHTGARGELGVKHLVREEAGHRCERCKHPYTPEASVYDRVERPEEERLSLQALEGVEWDYGASIGEGLAGRVGAATNWSPCDERCGHGGPLRSRKPGGDWRGWPLPTAHYADSGEWRNVPDAVRDGQEVQAAWRILTVHHLNGRKHDLRWWNLIAACQRCHLWLQQTVIMERVYPWEHDEYFKPHAAGWYAYAYRGENLTKMQTVARLDDLLGLELAA